MQDKTAVDCSDIGFVVPKVKGAFANNSTDYTLLLYMRGEHVVVI